MRLILGSQALQNTVKVLKERKIAGFEAQTDDRLPVRRVRLIVAVTRPWSSCERRRVRNEPVDRRGG